MDIFANILAAFGLSGSAGLNAYLPLLIVALAARFTPLLKLNAPWDVMTNGWVIAVLVILLIVEFFADKVPAVNHINDAIQTFVRPTAGAVLFAASTSVIGEIHPVVAFILGLLVAGGVHVAKSAVVRPAVTATTGGVGQPVVSVLEDVLAAIVSLMAVLLPMVLAGLFILGAALMLWWLWRRNARATAR